MVLTEILNTLNNDTELQLLLGGTTIDKKIYAFSANKLNSIVYKYIELQSNKIIGQSRLEFTINTLQVDYSLNLQILNRVKKLLLTLASENFSNTILKVEQSGGGIMENNETKTIHNKIFLTIKYREEV